MDKSRREIEESLNSSRNMPTWVFWPKLIKMIIWLVIVLIASYYLFDIKFLPTEKPKTEQSRQTQSSF